MILWWPNSCHCASWIPPSGDLLMLLRFRFLLFILMYSCIRWQLSKVAPASCLWIPLCCFSLFPTLIIPSSVIKLQISSLPYSFSSLNHWCSCSHRAWWFCMLSRSLLQLLCRCVSSSSPRECCCPLGARRQTQSAVLLFGVGRVRLWAANCQAWAFPRAAAAL